MFHVPTGAGAPISTVAPFPRERFTIEVRPEVMRAAARTSRTLAEQAREWDGRLVGAAAASWSGSEAEAYRRSRTAYRPMLASAHEAFSCLERELDRCATTIEYAMRRMDLVRATAERAWQRLQERTALAVSAADELNLATPTPWPRYQAGNDPQVQALRHEFDVLLQEATSLKEKVSEATAGAATAIGRLAPPGAIPQPGADAYGPVVVGRDVYGATATGQFEIVKGGVTYRVEQSQLSDGRWATRLTATGSAGVVVEPPIAELHVGAGKDALEMLPSASAELGVAVGSDLLWYSATRAEAERTALAFGVALATRGPGALRKMRPDVVGITGEARLAASAVAHGGPAPTVKTGNEVGALGIGGNVLARTRSQWGRDGSRESALTLAGRWEAGHPAFDKGTVHQKTYGSVGEVEARVRHAADGQSVLVLTSRSTPTEGSNRYEKRWARLLTPAEARRFEMGLVQASRGAGLLDEKSPARRSLNLVTETWRAGPDSPEVRNGTVDYAEFTYEVDEVAHPSIEGKLAGVGMGGEIEVTRERLVEERRRG